MLESDVTLQETERSSTTRLGKGAVDLHRGQRTIAGEIDFSRDKRLAGRQCWGSHRQYPAKWR